MKGIASRQGRRNASQIVVLREDIFRGDKPHRVDRDAGIIYDVKVVGLSSPNSHGMTGAESTIYTLEALNRAKPLYEGVAVNINHPPRERPNVDRDAEDRFGRLINVRVTESGMFADLEYLKSHPMAERICEAAERMPEIFGMSHNATGKGEVQKGHYVIVEIPDVRSVDVVADAATTSSLFESKPMKTQVAVRKVFEGLLPRMSADGMVKLKQLLEDDMIGPDTMMDEPPPPEEAGGSPEDALWNGIRSAIMAIVDDTSMGGDEKAAKVKEFLRAHEKLTAGPAKPEESVAEGDDEEDEDKKKKVQEQYPKGGNKKGQQAAMGAKRDDPHGDYNESRERKPMNDKDAKQLRERRERYCKIAGLAPTKDLMEGLLEMSEDGFVKHLESLKALAGNRGGNSPRSVSPGSVSGARNLDVKDFSRAVKNGLY